MKRPDSDVCIPQLFYDSKLAFVQRHGETIGSAQEKPMRVGQLSRQNPSAVSKRMLNQKLDRLRNEAF